MNPGTPFPRPARGGELRNRGGRMALAALCFGLLLRTAIGVALSRPGSLPFDSARVGDTIRREIVVSNGTDKPLVLKEISSSCTCLRVIGRPRDIAPRQEGKILLEYRPVKPGHADIELLVETDRAADPIIAWRWTGQVLPAIAVQRETPGVPLADIFVSAPEFAALPAGGGAMLVDIRDSSSFNQCHIDGSVNLPWLMLKTVGTFKSRSIVVTGSGADDHAVVRGALELKQSGFESIRALRGGVRAWIAGGRAVRGTAIGSARMAFVEPIDFLSTPHEDWLVLEIEPGEAPAAGRIPGAMGMRARTDAGGAFISEVIARLQTDSGYERVLFVSAAGENYEVIEKLLPKTLPAPVFYLNGGARAYRELIAQRGAMHDRREIVLTAGQVAGSSVMTSSGAGCATCPKKAPAK